MSANRPAKAGRACASLLSAALVTLPAPMLAAQAAPASPAANSAVPLPGADGRNAPEISTREVPSTLRSRVELVLLPVIVRDNAGHPVANLHKEDFEILDNRRAQIINTFSVEGAESSAPIPETQAGDLDAAVGEALPNFYIAYFFDDLHLEASDLQRARSAAEHQIDSAPLHGRIGIYSTSGQTTQDFTDDRARLQDALRRLQPRSLSGTSGRDCPSISYYLADRIINQQDPNALQAATYDAQNCRFQGQGGQLQQVALNAAHTTALREVTLGEQETLVSLDSLRELVTRLSTAPGGRTIVLVSPGFITPQHYEDVGAVMDSAIRAKVVINSLDARGLIADRGMSAASNRHEVIPASHMSLQQYDRDADRANSDILADVADGTGGTLFHNNNNLELGFAQLAMPPASWYLLGFAPQNVKRDGSFHKLEVRLKVPQKMNVQTRKGYYAPARITDPAEVSRQQVEDAVFSQEEIKDIPMELQTQFYKESEFAAKLAAIVQVQWGRFPFRKESGRNCDLVKVVAAVFDRNGSYIAGFEKDVDLRLLDATLGNQSRSGFRLDFKFNVQQGDYLVRVVARDQQGQMMAARNAKVRIP